VLWQKLCKNPGNRVKRASNPGGASTHLLEAASVLRQPVQYMTSLHTGMPEADPAFRRACAEALDRALALAPFYQQWRTIDPGKTVANEQRYATLPVLTKRDLRAHMPKGFVPRDHDLKTGLANGSVEFVATSGTTEERASTVWHQPWWDTSEQAAAALHTGLDAVVRAAPREAVLTTPLCAGSICHVGDLSMEERSLGRLLFLNQKPDPTRWTTVDMDRMIDELNRFQPELLEADPAYLAILCRHASHRHASLHPPRFIVLTYEYPSCIHLRSIRRVFPNTPLVSSYGSTETGHVFTQCECSEFHQNTATCHVDFQPLPPRHGGPSIGRILVTLLGNPWLALLRFDVGDLVRLAERPCPCGRTAGLTLTAIEGRIRDLTFAVDGRAITVGALDRAVGHLENLLAYQLEQTDQTAYTFRFVAASGTGTVSSAATQTLQHLYGPDSQITTQRESAIAAEQSGKFRLAKTLFPWNMEELFARQQPATSDQ